MSYHQEVLGDIPEETCRVAKASFPKGNVYMALRDELGHLFADVEFHKLFARVGQPGLSAWRLTMVTILQFMEGLPDRQAADAVRGRIEWKYLLGLDITDEGFDASVLSEFRDRLVEAEAADYFLNKLLEHFKAVGLLTNWKEQRTDATHILGNVRVLNQLILVGETRRACLNALAVVDPDWLCCVAQAEWYERYELRMDEWRLPRSETAREALGLQIAQDGYALLNSIYDEKAAIYLRQIPKVKILRQVWVQQFMNLDGKIALRSAKDLPPAHLRIQSPYETEARPGVKRHIAWLGYKLHVTETCAKDDIHLITHVETTPACQEDHTVLSGIHEDLARTDYLPEQHLVDAGYADSDNRLDSQQTYGIDLIGPASRDTSWQATAQQGFDISHFLIDWQKQSVTCPAGQKSSRWIPTLKGPGEDAITVRFSRPVCRACPVRELCTHSASRVITFLAQPLYDTLQAARAYEKTDEFKQTYAQRAGVESTFSQGTRAFELRRSRYRGLAKTHLQHVFTAIAVNIARAVNWLAQPAYSPPYVSPFAALAPA